MPPLHLCRSEATEALHENLVATAFEEALQLVRRLDQATGTIPLHARRPDGSTLVASGTPLPEPLPDWLLVELGGRYGKRRA